MALVTLQDLKHYQDISFTPKQELGVQMILDGLHGELEALLRRPIEVTEFVETWVVPEGTNPYMDITTFAYGGGSPSSYYASQYIPAWTAAVPIYLDQSPVLSIQSVTRTPSQSSITSAVETLAEGSDFTRMEWGLFVQYASHGDSFEIAYTAGLDGENLPLFKLMILRAASREVQNLHDDTIGLKDLEGRQVALADVGFTDAEEKRLKRYRRNRI